MIKLICTIITLQYLLTGLFGENSNSSGESTCSYNVIIPTTDVVKKCDAYAEAHLEKLRKRLQDLQKQIADGIKSTENIDLLNKCAPTESKVVYESCEEARSAGLNETEVYELWDVPQKVNKIYTEVKPVEGQKPKSFARIVMSGKSRRTLCHLSSEHGWIVIMQRSNMDVDFNRTWKEYRDGFGNLRKGEDFWWGLENVHYITNQYGRTYRLRINFIYSNNTLRRAEYSTFKIADESTKYRTTTLSYDFQKSNASNQLGNYRKFWTNDDDDTGSYWNKRYNCVNLSKKLYPGAGGGWWFQGQPRCLRQHCINDCGRINLNAKTPYYKGYRNITSVSMKIRLNAVKGS